MVVGGLAGGAVLATLGSFFMSKYGVWLLVTVFAILLIAGIAWWIFARSRDSRGRKSLWRILKANGSDDSEALEDGDAKKLEGLLDRFNKGVDRLAGDGYDPYGKPWYLIIGEPGSGKTCAVRNSGLLSQKQIQEMTRKGLAGTGPTLNMNWWFTEKAIFIDTAGEMVFPQSEEESNERWTMLLQKLKQARPRCPINGVFLAVDANELDAGVDLEHRAERVANQLGVIAKAVKVRFPVYVMLTKCDKLPGFRTLFERVGHEACERGILGWSSDSADVAPTAEKISTALTQLATNMHRHALGLMNPDDSANYTLFLLQGAMKRIAERVGEYAEAITTRVEAKNKPFLRGFYLTSSGSTRDPRRAIIAALQRFRSKEGGTAAGKVSSAADTEEIVDRPYFLRGLFSQKILPEQGLVTEDVSPRAALKRRQWWVWGTAAAVSVIFCFFAWRANVDYSNSIGKELDAWRAADDAGKSGSYSIAPSDKIPWAMKNNRVGGTSDGEQVLGWYESLQRYTEQETKPSGILALISWASSRIDRGPSFELVMRKGFVDPLIENGQKAVKNSPPPSGNKITVLAGAVRALIAMEGYLAHPDPARRSAEYSDAVSQVLIPIARFGFDGGDAAVEDYLKRMTKVLNSRALANVRHTLISTNHAQGALYVTGSPISEGVRKYSEARAQEFRQHRLRFDDLKQIITTVEGIREKEIGLLNDKAPGPLTRDGRISEMVEGAKNLKRLAQEKLREGELPQGQLKVLQNEATRVRAEVLAAIQQIPWETNAPALAKSAQDNLLRDKGFDLAYEVAKYLEGDSRRIGLCETNYMAPAQGDSRPPIEIRLSFYQQVQAAETNLLNIEIVPGDAFRGYVERRDSLRSSLAPASIYTGPLSAELASWWGLTSTIWTRNQDASYWARYKAWVGSRVQDFGVESVSLDRLKEFLSALKSVSSDLTLQRSDLSAFSKPEAEDLIGKWQIKKEALRKGYERNLLNETAAAANGFPLVFNSGTDLSVDDVTKFRQTFRQKVEGYKKEFAEHFGPLSRDTLDRVQPLLDIASLVVDEEGNEREVTLAMSAILVKQFTGFLSYPYFQLRSGKSQGERSYISDYTSTRPAYTLKVPISSSAELVVAATMEDFGAGSTRSVVIKGGNWAVLKWLRDSKGVGWKDGSGGANLGPRVGVTGQLSGPGGAEVTFPVTTPQTKDRPFGLTVQFAGPIPKAFLQP